MKFLFSTIGQKIQIAISGILLAFFLLFHLFNNLVLFSGSENFNNMVSFLKKIHIFIRVMEFGLLAILLLHVLNAIITTVKNWRANNGKYAVSPKPNTSSVNSRTMIFSGLIILIFFIIHLRYYWYTFQNLHSDAPFFNYMLSNKFGFLGHTPTAIFYIIAILFIAAHLKHGAASIFKTLGINSRYRNNIFQYISFLFWAIIPSGFIIIICAIQIGIIR